MTCPARILIVTADMGGGHNATARALEERAHVLWPDCDVRWADTLDVMGPGIGPLFRRIYVVNVQSTPWLYEFFYSSLVRWHWFAASSKRVVGAWCGRRLQPLLDDYAPDLIFSVYPLGSAGLEWLRRHRGMRTPTGAWVSDFAPHPFWVYRDLDLHLVMHETAIGPALAAEAHAVVEVCAPPVTSDFAPGDLARERSVLGMGVDAFVALVSTGAYAFGDVEAGVDALLNANPTVQVVVACGRNDPLLHKLLARGLPPNRLQALGWVQDMPIRIRAADVVVTNAGGATALEALACGVPVVMFDPIAAHGRANAGLMAESGLAVLCPSTAELTATVRELITQPQRLHTMRRVIEKHLHGHDLDSGLRTLARQRDAVAGAAGPSTAYWQPREQSLRAADAFFLHVETPQVAQQVGAVLILDPVQGRALEIDAVRHMLTERVPQLPSLRKRLRSRGRVRSPRWELLDDVPVAEHLSHRVLAAPQELHRAVDEFFSIPLPRDRPLWAMQVLGGLDEERSAFLVKLHHSLGDGIAVVETMDGVLDTPSAPPYAPVRRMTPAPSPIRGLRTAMSLPVGLWELARAGKAPTGPYNGPLISPQRHLVLAELPATDVRRLAHRLKVRSSELALSVVAGALHRLITARGGETKGMYQRAAVPVSLPRGTHGSRGWGNWTGAATVDLPVGPMRELDRLRWVQHELTRRSTGGQPEAAQLVLRLVGLLPYPLHGVLARRLYCADWFNAIVSYIPGRARQQFFAGARVAHGYPVLPIAENVGLSVGVMPWASDVGFGITLDATLVPDGDKLHAALHETFAELATDAQAWQ